MTNLLYRVVIPARLESSRLPGKVLLPLAGKPMLQWVWERACASNATEVVIATDSRQVATAAAVFGADVCMTSAACQSGTDRVAEVCRQRSWEAAVPVVNLQGDAPLMPASSIERVAQLLLAHTDAAIATLCVPVTSVTEFQDINVVKVVADATGRALYFSRAGIPALAHGAAANSDWQGARRHLGLYAYRIPALLRLQGEPPCALELTEKLEQLRALWLGMEIRIAEATEAHGPDVDTPADMTAVEALLLAEMGHK